MIDSADKVEIHELISRYCHILDTRNWADLDQIFLPDSVVDSGPTLGVYRGLDAIAAFWRDYPHPDGHHALNVLVEGERPDGTVAVVTKGPARPGELQRRRLPRRGAPDRARVAVRQPHLRAALAG